MNLFKRAWWRLRAHPGKTVMLVGLFFVICTLVLSGFLIRSAAGRAAASAKETVGVVATMQLDLDAYLASGQGTKGGGGRPGTIGPGADLHVGLVDRICRSTAVARCNYTSDAAAAPTGKVGLYQPVPPPDGQSNAGTDLFKAEGVRDLDAVQDFRDGDSAIVSGSGITPDSDGSTIVIEQRMARHNHLKVGDRLSLRAGTVDPEKGGISTKQVGFTVGGIYANDTADGSTYVPPIASAWNQIYVTPEGATRLQAKDPAAGGAVVDSATFTLHAPDDLAKLRQDAKAAGADLRIFPLSVNDKQYRTLVGPIDKTADFASITVWLVAVAGTAVLALVIASNMRERRKEMGILLSLGERKPRLLGQQLVEVAGCAVLAVGFAAAGSQVIAQAIGDRLLSGQVSSAEHSAAGDAGRRDPSDPTGVNKPDTPQVEPIDTMDIELGAGAVGRIGATGLGIATLATIVPGARLLRLNPRDILTKGD